MIQLLKDSEKGAELPVRMLAAHLDQYIERGGVVLQTLNSNGIESLLTAFGPRFRERRERGFLDAPT
jgi:hypothetical protein